jgi:hypothetical protein
MMSVAFFIAKSSSCAKNHKKETLSFVSNQTSIFHDEETSSTAFPDAKKARIVLQQSPKSKPPSSKTKKTRRPTDKQKNKLTGMQNLKIQKFNFNAHAHHELISGASHCENLAKVEFSDVLLSLSERTCLMFCLIVQESLDFLRNIWYHSDCKIVPARPIITCTPGVQLRMSKYILTPT